MLKLDYEELESSASTLSAQGDQFEDCIRIMNNVINELPNYWEAETCDQYVQEFNDALPTLNDVRQLIADMAAQMNKIAENFREADSNMANQMK